ncbi:hypothetical protein JCM8097_007432 [Rhodosporidiobolus ruineniae]
MVQHELVYPVSAAAVTEFVDAHPPSDNSSRRHGKWLVAKTSPNELPASQDEYSARFNAFKMDARPFENEMTSACSLIEETAPVRGNKASGTKSQKALRENEHAKFHHHVRELAATHNVHGGCWITFLNNDEVDDAWERTLLELVGPNGRLRQAGANYAKCSTTGGKNFPYTISIFARDEEDVVSVETIFRVCAELGGFSPTSFKTCAFTLLGINSKHPSKIAVSKYSQLTFMTRPELDAAKRDYQRRGPAPSIGPLSGAPLKPAIDWRRYADTLKNGGTGAGAGYATPAASPRKPAASGSKKGKGRKKAPRAYDYEYDECDGEWECGGYDDELGYGYGDEEDDYAAFSTPTPRTPRKAAQKAAATLHDQAEEGRRLREEYAARKLAASAAAAEQAAQERMDSELARALAASAAEARAAANGSGSGVGKVKSEEADQWAVKAEQEDKEDDIKPLLQTPIKSKKRSVESLFRDRDDGEWAPEVEEKKPRIF